MQTTGELFLGKSSWHASAPTHWIWVMLNGTCVGKIVACVATLFQKRMSPDESTRSRRCCCTSNRIPAEIIRASAESTAPAVSAAKIVPPRVHSQPASADLPGRL